MQGYRILIAGVGGRIGVPLAKKLKEMGNEVVGFARFNQPWKQAIRQDLDKKGIETHCLNCADLPDLSFLGKVDLIFFLCSLKHGASDPKLRETVFKVNSYFPKHLIQSFPTAPVVHASTANVYGLGRGKKETDPLQPTEYYSQTRMWGENSAIFNAKEYGNPLAIARIAHANSLEHSGVVQEIVVAVKGRIQIPLELGYEINISYRDDVVEKLIQIADFIDQERPREPLILNVSSGPIDVWQAAEIVKDILQIDNPDPRRAFPFHWPLREKTTLSVDTGLLNNSVFGPLTKTPEQIIRELTV